jgi:glycosyltransferase involved in cell wall biosynthesis
VKVVHLIDSGGLYGAEKMLLSLSNEQALQGLRPTILSCGVVGEGAKAIEHEAKRLGIECVAWRMKSGLNVKGMQAIWRWVHRHEFTHIHSHGYKFNILLALTRKRSSGIKLISTIHGYVAPKAFSKMWLNLLLDRWALKKMDAVVFVSRAMLTQRAFKSLRLRCFEVINNGMDFSLFSSGAKSEGDLIVENLPKELLKIGFVGRLSREKGVDLLLEAFALLSRDRADAQLVLCGEGPLLDCLEARARDLALFDRVVFAGFVNHVADVLEKMDIFVMPSLTEGMPMVLMEAMAANKKIVATRVGGMPEMLSAYERSALVAPGDRAQLKNAMVDVLGVTDVVSGGMSEIDTLFAVSRMAEGYRSLYLESLQGVV